MKQISHNICILYSMMESYDNVGKNYIYSFLAGGSTCDICVYSRVLLFSSRFVALEGSAATDTITLTVSRLMVSIAF